MSISIELYESFKRERDEAEVEIVRLREAAREAYDFLSSTYQNLSTGDWDDEDAGLVASALLDALEGATLKPDTGEKP